MIILDLEIDEEPLPCNGDCEKCESMGDPENCAIMKERAGYDVD